MIAWTTMNRPMKSHTDQTISDRSARSASAPISGLNATLGDRLGLFKDLAANGPATSGELAARTGIDKRYARAWLYALTSAGYLEYDPVNQSFTLPPEHHRAA